MKKVTKYVYNLFIENVYTVAEKTISKWSRDCNDINKDDFVDSFHYVCIESNFGKLQYFQFRLIHRILPVYKYLFKI